MSGWKPDQCKDRLAHELGEVGALRLARVPPSAYPFA
jgi:hypothetical protein